MVWNVSECPVGATDLDACQAPGCRALARVRFMCFNDATNERRFTFRCDEHVDQMRSSRAPAAPKPAQQSIDPTAAALEPKPAEQPKRPPKIYPLPDGEMPAVCTSCADAIFWIITEAGRRMPIDAFGERAGQSHFISCKHADQHRKPR